MLIELSRVYFASETKPIYANPSRQSICQNCFQGIACLAECTIHILSLDDSAFEICLSIKAFAGAHHSFTISLLPYLLPSSRPLGAFAGAGGLNGK